MDKENSVQVVAVTGVDGIVAVAAFDCVDAVGADEAIVTVGSCDEVCIWKSSHACCSLFVRVKTNVVGLLQDLLRVLVGLYSQKS